ncbi:KTSC domain-containing protein [Patescibacteria group bacterium]|nr:KTSC domain-containing protein [Patescibacteria group bacterium]MBU1519369.1 KTSC domain-containing protein [Patescibacteria group bacterium]MBU1730450.1 KTSC domain-containing protein [Patescibacteria group bacterium]MBU2416800.1 KTSC domain-containing protein [Patescibacteria group bacterium]MBU2460878.1 KTSC domain-containing protein [Patescibacteria group bacterium]
MQRTQVNSSNICSIGYDMQADILEVEFISGDIYQYFNVPEYLHQQFLNTSSHGQFLNDHIRYNYRYQKIK